MRQSNNDVKSQRNRTLFLTHSARVIQIRKISSPQKIFLPTTCGGNDDGDRDGDDVGDSGGGVGDEAAIRKAWILEQLAAGKRIGARDVARHFACSVRTAERDLNVLREIDKIEFFSTPGTGYYRLIREGTDSH